MVSSYVLLKILRHSKMKRNKNTANTNNKAHLVDNNATETKPSFSQNKKATTSSQNKKATTSSSCQSQRKATTGKTIHSTKDNQIQNNVKYDQNKCRVCLKDGVIPIFGSKDLSQDLATFTGIDLKVTDRYPKYLCVSCNTLLKAAVIFRNTAQDTEQKLRAQELYKDKLVDQSGDETNSNYEEYGECFAEENVVDQDLEIQIEKKKYKSHKEKPFHCVICDTDFNTIFEYKSHRVKAGHDPYRSSCPICKKTFISYNLKKHIESQHVYTDPYMCDICGKTLRVYNQLLRHRESHFSDKYPYKCPQCPYRGKLKEYVKSHIKTHSEEKPFHCDQCPFKAARAYNLKKHMLVHKTDFEFQCDQCEKGFHSKPKLLLHIKVHHLGIRDQVCKICGKVFGFRRKLLRHLHKVHKKKGPGKGRYWMLDAEESEAEQQEQAYDQTFTTDPM